MAEADRLARIAAVHGELSQLEARDEAVRLRPRRKRRVTGPSVVYSIRLDPAEVAALEAQAAALEMKPTALARNLIRGGLAGCSGDVVARAVDRLEGALDELRAVVR